MERRTQSSLLIAAAGALWLRGPAAPAADALRAPRPMAPSVASGGLLRNARLAPDASGACPGWRTFDAADRWVPAGPNQWALACAARPGKTEHGASQVVHLGQQKPWPILASAFSRCEGVPRPEGAHYSLYLDLTFTDGTTSYAHLAPFSNGSHGWERRQVTIYPPRPVREVSFSLVFRSRAGSALFRSPSLVELRPGLRAVPFDGALIAPMAPTRAPAPDVRLACRNGLEIGFESRTGSIVSVRSGGEVLSSGRPGGLLLRDHAAAGPFVPVVGPVRRVRGGLALRARAPGLGARVEMVVRDVRRCLRLDGTLYDETRRDRALTLYLTLPLRRGLTWWDDPRRSRTATGRGPLENTTAYPVAGAGRVSRYPIACMGGARGAVCLGTPLRVPRFCRTAYYPDTEELVLAFDLGLSRRERRSPSRATFSAVLYASPAAWGFRGALAAFHALFPNDFARRIPREGLWVFIPGASAVPNHEDFGFAYQEGAATARWDEQHGLLTFAYTEPVSFWMSLPPEKPRTREACIEHLHRLAAEERRAGRPGLACTTELTGVREPDGEIALVVVKAFGVDGGMFGLNPNPAIPSRGSVRAAGRFKRDEVMAALLDARRPLPTGWEAGSGSSLESTVRRSGARSLRVHLAQPGGWTGVSQRVTLSQQRPEPLLLSGWSRALAVQGTRGPDYALYADLVYADGTPLHAQTVCFDTGTHDWQYGEHLIRPEKPVKSATLHLLLRNRQAGIAWFDDVYLGPPGGRSLLTNGDFEGPPAPPAEVDGAYIDSLEMGGAWMDFEPTHVAHAQEPLCFEAASGRVGVANILAQYEFVRELAREMHAQRKWMLANDVLRTFPWFAAHLDVLGTETTWFAPQPGGAPSLWKPWSDQELLYRRSMSGSKPFCFLQNTPFDGLTAGLVERYLKRSLFYAMYPGMFASTDVGGHYFSNPAWFERDRPLFRRIVPMVRMLSRAGWEPVTQATTDRPEVLVERYGRPPGPVYLTLMNDSDLPCSFGLRVHASLGVGARSARSLLGTAFGGRRAAAVPITGMLGAWEVDVLELR